MILNHWAIGSAASLSLSMPFISLFSHRSHFLTSGRFSSCLNRSWVKEKSDFPGIQDYIPSNLTIINPVVSYSKYLILLPCADIWEITTFLKRGSWISFASCNTCNSFYLSIYFKSVYYWISFCISRPFLWFWQDSFKFLTWSVKFVPHANEILFLSIM